MLSPFFPPPYLTTSATSTSMTLTYFLLQIEHQSYLHRTYIILTQMAMSWATIAATPRPSQTPSQRMQELERFCATQTQSSILRHALGLDHVPGAAQRLAPLFDQSVVVCVDTEAWTKNTDQMTEIGLAVFAGKDIAELNDRKKPWHKERRQIPDLRKHLGDFGEEMLKKITFYHLRIVETAHLKSDSRWMKGAEGNRFGHSRFVTFAEARDVLDNLLSQPIVSLDPALKGCKKPVVLVGHAMNQDEQNLMKRGLRYDWHKHSTIVAKIDTQSLAKATSTWIDPRFPNNQVGLNTLTKKLGFEHEDAHTACNDAARTLICAIQMVLPETCKVGSKKSMQAVAWAIEEQSRSTIAPVWGSAHCCTRCGSRDHDDKEGERCEVTVFCNSCAYFDKVGEQSHWASHTEEYCVHVAKYNAWNRRCNDAMRKARSTPPGPPRDSHCSFDPLIGEYVSGR